MTIAFRIGQLTTSLTKTYGIFIPAFRSRFERVDERPMQVAETLRPYFTMSRSSGDSADGKREKLTALAKSFQRIPNFIGFTPATKSHFVAPIEAKCR